MTDEMYGDGENAARLWLRSVPYLYQRVGNRTYFRVPEQERPELPCIEVVRVGGVPDDQGFDVPNLSFVCYGENKNQASSLAMLVAQALNMQSWPVTIAPANATIVGGRATSVHPMSGQSWAKRYHVAGWIMLRRFNLS